MIRTALLPACAASVSAALILGILYGAEFLLNPHGELVDSWRGGRMVHRWSDALPVHGRVGDDLYTWGHVVKNNRYGFREREFESPKPPGVLRVMVLGDSLTWGTGLAVEERYTAVAEDLLNRASSDSAFEVLNFGLEGISTADQRDILEEYRDLVEPDLIVVGFCFNDPKPRSLTYSFERETLRQSMTGRVVERTRELGRRAGLYFLAELQRHGFYAAAEAAGLIPGWQTALRRSYAPSSDNWLTFVRALRDIKATSDTLGLPAPVFAVLNQGRRSSDYLAPDGYLVQYLAWYRQAEAAARDAGFAAYNHEREIPRRIRNEPMDVNALDEHPAANLNRVFGEKLHLEVVEAFGTRR